MKDLPSQLAEIGAAAQSLGEAIDLYQACVGFVCERYRGPVSPQRGGQFSYFPSCALFSTCIFPTLHLRGGAHAGLLSGQQEGQLPSPLQPHRAGAADATVCADAGELHGV